MNEEEAKTKIKQIQKELKESHQKEADERYWKACARLDKLVDSGGFPAPINGGDYVKRVSGRVGEKGNRYTVDVGLILTWDHIEWLLDKIDQLQAGDQ